MALLEFKAFVKSGGHDADDLLPSWVNLNDPKDDCCKWERVTCDYATKGHVIELSLNNTRQFDISSLSIFDPANSWYLNVSLFQPFKELRILNLSFNVIAGWIQSKDLASLSTLPKLKRLSLENNMVNEDIISILGTLPLLTSLDLSDNQLEGPLSKRDETVCNASISTNDCSDLSNCQTYCDAHCKGYKTEVGCLISSSGPECLCYGRNASSKSTP